MHIHRHTGAIKLIAGCLILTVIRLILKTTMPSFSFLTCIYILEFSFDFNQRMNDFALKFLQNSKMKLKSIVSYIFS